MNSHRIAGQAREFEFFDEIILFSEYDITDFVNKHRSFIESNRHGYGCWIWKPKIIHDTLLKMNDNDILVYCDAGIYLNINGKSRFLEYIEMLSDVDMITFSTNDFYKAIKYVGIDAIMEYYPNLLNESDINSCYAGVMIIKKTSKTLNFINDWLELCNNYDYLLGKLSMKYTIQDQYVGNDSDCGLFNLCLAKYKISKNIYPDECNVYTEDGLQTVHAGINPKNTDWSKLNDKPFQIRRITPKFY